MFYLVNDVFDSVRSMCAGHSRFGGGRQAVLRLGLSVQDSSNYLALISAFDELQKSITCCN
jgi:hypothetical protein